MNISLPAEFAVGNAYPNPFNPSTNVSVELSTDANVSIQVFNIMGQLVDIVSDNQMVAGKYSFTWDASSVTSGVYFISTQIGPSLTTQKVMLIK